MLTDSELAFYARQLLLPHWDIESQLNLKNASVMLIGMGGLGCPASEILARAGVGRLTLVDDDIIEVSNLQRQTLYAPKDIGQSKALTAKTALTRINPHIDVQAICQRLTAEKADELFGERLYELTKTDDVPDLLLDGSDNFATRYLLNRISVEYGIPLLSASAIGFSGQLALFEPKKQTGCYACVFGASKVASDAETENDEGDNNNSANCASSGVLASTTAVMGGLQANVALQYLGRGINPLRGKLLLWDGMSMSQKMMRYERNERCLVCGYQDE